MATATATTEHDEILDLRQGLEVARAALERELAADHHWCRYGHGRDDGRPGAAPCTCGKVARDRRIRKALALPGAVAPTGRGSDA